METLYLRIEKNGRKGKTVTIIEGFTRHSDEIGEIAKKIKVACGTGGTTRNGYIEIQGDFQDWATRFLQKLGFIIKK